MAGRALRLFGRGGGERDRSDQHAEELLERDLCPSRVDQRVGAGKGYGTHCDHPAQGRTSDVPPSAALGERATGLLQGRVVFFAGAAAAAAAAGSDWPPPAAALRAA